MSEDLGTNSVAPDPASGISPDARRTAIALLIGVVLIALYALWNLGSLLTGGLQGPEWVSAALMLAIFALSPAVAWNLLAEIRGRGTGDGSQGTDDGSQGTDDGSEHRQTPDTQTNDNTREAN